MEPWAFGRSILVIPRDRKPGRCNVWYRLLSLALTEMMGGLWERCANDCKSSLLDA